MTTASTEESATPAAAKSSPTPWIFLKSTNLLLASPVSNLGYPAWGTLLCFGQRRGQSEDLARPPWN